MKNFRQLLIITILFYSVSTISQGSKEASLKDKKIIYVFGGWKGHSPKQSVDVFVPKLRAAGAKVTVYDNLNVYTDKDIMDNTDLIIQIWTMGKITKAQFDGLESAIISGTGFSGWHGGIGDAFRDNLRYQFMVGGQFIFHPGGKIDYGINIIDRTDPITKDISDFNLKHTEQYYMLIDPNTKVLAVSKFVKERYEKPEKKEIRVTGSVMPVVWKKNYGKGRIFYSSIGHFMTDFDVPEVLKMQMRGFAWASEGKYHEKEELINPIYMK